MINFIPFGPVHQIEQNNGSPYSDAANHCKNWNYYKGGGRITSTHEASHGIAADLRNGAIKELNIVGAEYMDYPDGAIRHRLFVPDNDNPDQLITGDRYNAFYLLSNRAIKLKELNCRKRDAIKFIPERLRYYRFKTYVSGQTAWDGEPLYLFDEGVAYCNGLECAIFDKTSDGADWCFSVIEFISYCVGVLMAGSPLEDNVKAFAKWHLDRTMTLYGAAKDRLPWAQMEECLDILKNDNDDKVIQMREFMASELDFDITGEGSDETNFMV